MVTLALDALVYLLFTGLAVILPGLAVLRALRLRLEPALVLPTGIAACAACALAAATSGIPQLFPALVLSAGAAFLLTEARRRIVPGRIAARARFLALALVPVAVFLALLLPTRFLNNRVLPSGEFRVDSLNWQDAAFHAGLVRELTHSFPPEVPGFSGVPLSYHYGLPLVRSAALRFAGIDPYDAQTRFDPLLMAAALVLALRATVLLLGGGRMAAVLAGFTFLAGDFGFLWAFSPVPHYWIDRLGGNFFLAVVDANSAVPSLAIALSVILAVGRRAAGGGRGYLALATLLAIALPSFKVFTAAHLALGLGVAFLFTRDRRALLPPLLALCVSLASVLLVAGDDRIVVRLDPLLILPEAPRWLATLGPDLATWTWLLLWLGASLGLRLVGLPRAIGALGSGQAAPCALATMALSGWPIGMVFDVSPRSLLPQERPFNEAGYFLEQSGALLWIFTVLTLAELARRHGRAVLTAAATLTFPTTFQFVVEHRTRPPLDIPQAVLAAMKVLERDSRPGDVVLQRPHPRWPPPPVVLASRRVPITRIYPYPSQFLTSQEYASRHSALRQFFGATGPSEAIRIARRFGATHAVAYEDDVIAEGAHLALQPIFEDPAVRVYRIRYR